MNIPHFNTPLIEKATETPATQLDVFSTLYPVTIDVPNRSNAPAVEISTRFKKGEFFYLYGITASYNGAGITKADSPLLRMVDGHDRITLQSGVSRFYKTEDEYYSVETAFSPGLATNQLKFITPFERVFMPESQLLFYVKSRGLNDVTLEILLHGYAIRKVKV